MTLQTGETVPGDYDWSWTGGDAGLAECALPVLLAELLRRIEDDPVGVQDDAAVRVASRLHDRMGGALEYHNNRYSLRRHNDLLAMYRDMLPLDIADLAGSTVLDLGCGAENPLGMGFVLLALGARRAFGCDLAVPVDPPRDWRMLATLFKELLVEPAVLLRDLPLQRAALLQRLRDFDFARLAQGDGDGAPAHRLALWNRPLEQLPLADGSVDLVLSTSFFEHVDDVDGIIAALARMTRRGGYHAHSIDGVDHRSYGDPRLSALAFLRDDDSLPMVGGCNRLRPCEYLPLFERHGFSIVRRHVHRRHHLTEQELDGFAPRFRRMRRDQLEELQLLLTLRKR